MRFWSRGEIAGTADQPGYGFGDRIEHFAGRFAGGEILLVRKRGQPAIPLFRQFALQQRFHFPRRRRVRALVSFEGLDQIIAPGPAAAADTIAERFIDAIRHKELRIFRPAVKPLRQLYLLCAERIAVRRRGILFVRGAVADDAVDNNERRSNLWWRERSRPRAQSPPCHWHPPTARHSSDRP